ncbi:hypothetical protein CEXT_370581 [Caerostris extrusa]|uniref:Uncharacterized protein n=1 Tax=Caerostris extrusa TaxID=172846 RepID=A0AAV4Y4J3_CAEEX|nr:hypothetical protein CEXT_370581 [Caerostris extrusa]
MVNEHWTRQDTRYLTVVLLQTIFHSHFINHARNVADGKWYLNSNENDGQRTLDTTGHSISYGCPPADDILPSLY